MGSSDTESLDGAPSGNRSTRFDFLSSVVTNAIDNESCKVDSASALTERALRRLENPGLAIQNILGLGSFGPYGCLAGLSFLGPDGKRLQLSPAAYCKSWGLQKSKKFTEAFWRRLQSTLELSRILSPLQLIVIAYVVPDDEASLTLEVCLDNLEKLTSWTSIVTPSPGDTAGEKKMGDSLKVWLSSCYSVLKIVRSKLEQSFQEVDSSVFIRKWSELSPEGLTWSHFCTAERLHASQILYIDFDNDPAWKIRRDKLISCLDQYPFFQDVHSSAKSELFPKLAAADNLSSFDSLLAEMGKIYLPLSLDELLGVPDSVTNKDSKSTPPMRARSKHHHKANAVSNKPAAGPTTSTATSSAASSVSGSSSTKPTGVSEKSNTSTGSKGKATYCYEFFNTGSCKHGANCRFAHIQPRRSPRLQQGDKSVKSSSSDGGKSFQSANSASVSSASASVPTDDEKQSEATSHDSDGSAHALAVALSHSTSQFPSQPIDPSNHDMVCASIHVSDGDIRIDPFHPSRKVKACCDSGSQVNLITRELVDKLALPIEQSPSPVRFSGIGGETYLLNETVWALLSLGNGFLRIKFGIVQRLPATANVLLNNEVSRQLLQRRNGPEVSLERVDAAIQSTLPDHWVRVRSAPGFLMRCRRMKDAEPRDTETQKFCLEVSVDSTASPGSTLTTNGKTRMYDYGFKMYKRLSPSQQESYDAAIQDFCKAGHWREVTETEVKNHPNVPVVVCFPAGRAESLANDLYVKNTNYKVRPVIDAVKLNSKFHATGKHSASYGGAPTAEILQSMRTNFTVPTGGSDTDSSTDQSPSSVAAANRVVVSLDVSRAFYRFRLAPHDDNNRVMNFSEI